MSCRRLALVVLLLAAASCNYRDPPTGPTVITTVTTTASGGAGGNGGAGGGTPTPGTPTPTPTPGGGTGTRTPDPATGTALPLPAYGAQVLQLYVASQAGGAALPLACPTGNANSWAFMDGLVDQLRQKDTRWGYFCRRGNCFDPSNDVVAYHATAGPETSGAAGVIGGDVIGDLCGVNAAQWLPLAFDQGALWTSRGRF